MSSGLNKGSGPQFETVYCDFSQTLESSYLQERIAPPIRFEVIRDRGNSKYVVVAKQVITYTRVVSKTGNFIDINKGAFTAPRQGTYRFFFQAESGQDQDGATTQHIVQARKNGVFIEQAESNLHSWYHNGFVHFSFTWTLQKGDKVDMLLSMGSLFVASKIKFAGELLY